MAFTTIYAINLKYDSGLAANKQWVADVLFKPTAATGETAPAATDGPLSTSGKASATRVHGDGTAAGFASPKDAVEKALCLIADCLSHNPTNAS